MLRAGDAMTIVRRVLHSSGQISPLLQVELPAGTRIEYKYVILEEQVSHTVLINLRR